MQYRLVNELQVQLIGGGVWSVEGETLVGCSPMAYPGVAGGTPESDEYPQRVAQEPKTSPPDSRSQSTRH